MHWNLLAPSEPAPGLDHRSRQVEQLVGHAERWHQSPEKAQAVLPACNSFGCTQDPVFRGMLPSTLDFCCLARANLTLARLSAGTQEGS